MLLEERLRRLVSTEQSLFFTMHRGKKVVQNGQNGGTSNFLLCKLLPEF